MCVCAYGGVVGVGAGAAHVSTWPSQHTHTHTHTQLNICFVYTSKCVAVCAIAPERACACIRAPVYEGVRARVCVYMCVLPRQCIDIHAHMHTCTLVR